MRIVPVLDLMHSQVVRGIAGRRSEYQPIHSPLASAPDPLAVAQAFRDHFGLTDLYLADLDAIGGAPPAIDLYSALQNRGFNLLVDAGLRTPADAGPLLAANLSGIVAGLETLAGPDVLRDLVKSVGAERLIFSLDLKRGQPLTTADWPESDAWGIARHAVALGVQRLLVLDLAHVGVGGGTGTEAFCRDVKQTWPKVELLAGGGVRGADDLEHLRRCGVDAVLVASALHDGRLTREDVTRQ